MGFLTSLQYLLVRIYYFLKSKQKMEDFQNSKNTDSKNSKATGAEQKFMVEISDFIVEKMIKFPRKVRVSAMKLVASNIGHFDVTEDPEKVGFLVRNDDDNDVFMEMEYYNDGTDPFFIMDIDEISSDEYLDYFNLNKIIYEIDQDRDIRSSEESDC